MASKHERTQRSPRPTLGCLFTDMSSYSDLFMGVYDEAQAQDVNLITILSSQLYKESLDRDIFCLPGPAAWDATLVFGGGVLHHLSDADAMRFLGRFRTRPLVLADRTCPGLPALVQDEYGTTKKLVEHLITVHRSRRIAYLLAGEEHAGARDRFRAYQDALAEHGIALDPQLISPMGAWDSGETLMRILLEERRVQLDAVVGTTGYMIYQAESVLREHGLRVPEDVALAGADDLLASRDLTAVSPRWRELGQGMVRSALAQLRGETAPESTLVPGRLVVRDSCGCWTSALPPAAPAGSAAETIQSLLDQGLGNAPGIAGGWGARLWQAFRDEIRSDQRGPFLAVLRRFLKESENVAPDLRFWQDVVSLLCQQAQSLGNAAAEAFRCEEICQQARILVADAIHRLAYEQMRRSRIKDNLLRGLDGQLAAARDVEELMNALAVELPALEVERCFLSLFDPPGEMTAMARLLLAFDQGRRRKIPAQGVRFPANRLVPQRWLQSGQRFSTLVVPLSFQKERLGFAVLGIPREHIVAYDSLGARVSGALKNVMLMQQAERRAVQMQTAADISQAASSILETDKLMQQAVTLIRERFGLDSVDLFLLGENRQLLLFAGAGRSGPEIPGRQNGLPLDPNSLLGWCVQNKKSRFVQHGPGGQDRLTSSQVNSELVVPLIVGERALGALRVQSAEPEAFTEDSQVVFDTLAGQLANAIENARLVEQIRRHSAELAVASEEAQKARWDAERADQLKTRLLANVSHELRTPLNVILGYCTAALGQPNPYAIDLPPLLRQDLERIFGSGEHLIRLINDLLDLSRAEIGELDLFYETVPVRTLLREAFQNMRQTPPHNAQVAWELHLPDQLPLLQADPVRLRQVLLNLLSNAKKFTQQGRIVLGADAAPPFLHVWLRDTGPGIPLDQQERIFEPFGNLGFTGRRPDGIGLGLSITRRLVALHGGSMRLESQPGQGSTFHLYFPLPDALGQPAREVGTAAQGSLLVLTSSSQPARAVAQLCETGQLDYIPLRLGDDLDRLARTRHPSAIAWDMNGATPADWELIDRIRNHPLLARLPFLVYGRDEGDPARTEIGVTGVLTKPVNQRTLLDYIAGCRPAQAAGAVLIVDDDAATRQFYRDLVTRALPDLAVLEAENGLDAMTQMQRAPLALVILDLVMPVMDGFAVLEAIRQNEATRQTPVLVMSGKSLTLEDVRRLDFAGVTFQGKGLFTEEEIVEAARHVVGGENALPSVTSALVKQALAYLHQNFARPISRGEIAHAVGVNESYLSKIFSAEVGIPVWEYLTRLRVQTACSLLRTTQKSVTEIAHRVGYDDLAYFSRIFRRRMGVSPQGYRK